MESARKPIRATTIIALAATLAATVLVTSPSQAKSSPVPGSNIVEVIEDEEGAMSIFYEDGAEFSSSTITSGPASSSISSSAPLASAAATGGHFTWSATWRASVTSRQWTTTKKANIYIRVAPIQNCKSTTKPQLSLHRSTTGRVGTVRQVPCAGGTYVWSMVDPGKFTFLLTGLVKPDAALYYSTSGAVGYDGSGA